MLWLRLLSGLGLVVDILRSGVSVTIGLSAIGLLADRRNHYGRAME